MKKKTDFLIIYEHRNRELGPACLLRAELEIRGYKVKILQQHDYRKALYRIIDNPRVLITFALRNENYMYNHVYGFAKNVRKVVNLQYEQIFSEKASETGFNLPTESAKYAVHLCWGENMYKSLISNDVKNAFVVGSLQLDFLRDDFIPYLKSNELMRNKYMISTEFTLLYISSFSFASLDKGTIERISKETKVDYSEFENISKKSRLKTLKTLEKILIKHENITVVYRPHPSEYVDDKINILVNKYKRFKLINEFSVREWIKMADYIVTWFSTSIVDAYYLGKKVVIYRPYKIPNELDSIIYKESNIITDSTTLEYELFNNSNTSFPIKSDVIDKFYSVDNDRASYERVSDLLEKVFLNDDYDLPKDFRWKINLKVILEPILKSLIEKFKLNEKSLISIIFPRFKKWIKFYRMYRVKQVSSIASDKEIESLTSKYKSIIIKNKRKD